MSGSGVCPSCGEQMVGHDESERKRCHDAVSGFVRTARPTESDDE